MKEKIDYYWNENSKRKKFKKIIVVRITRIDIAKQSMPWLLRSFHASEQKFWKDGSVNVRVLDYKERI